MNTFGMVIGCLFAYLILKLFTKYTLQIGIYDYNIALNKISFLFLEQLIIELILPINNKLHPK